MPARQPGHGAGDAVHSPAPRLAAMRRHQQDWRFAGVHGLERRVTVGDASPDGPEQRVDPGVAGDQDVLRLNALAKQVVLAYRGRRQMEGGDLARQSPVGLLGERRVKVAGTKAGLDVDYWNVLVEGRERSGECRGRVTLHDDGVGTLLPQGRSESLQDA